MEPDNTNFWILVFSLLAIYLICQRQFWLWLFLIGALASVFACIASIIHFHILGAIGFFFLAWILLQGTGKIAGDYEND